MNEKNLSTISAICDSLIPRNSLIVSFGLTTGLFI